jgi:predicted GNAT family acetyltransferase
VVGVDGGVAQRHATGEPIDRGRPMVEEQLDKFKQAAGERNQQRRLAARVDGAQLRPEPDEPLAKAQVAASHGSMHERIPLPVGASRAPPELDDGL